MLLKWLFTFLAILWLYEAIVRVSRMHNQRKRDLNNRHNQYRDDDYADYEEIKKDH